MAVFWDVWPAWEKMVFVLGIAIVLTVFAGLIKLAHQNRQLKKFTKLKDPQTADAEMAGSVVRSATFHPEQLRSNDIPFGVRAIESGVEVEGVWVSRNNSPASSAPPSPVMVGLDGPQAKSTLHASPQQPNLAMPRPVQPQKRASSVPSISVTHPDFTLTPPTAEASNERTQALGVSRSRTPGPRSYQPRRSSGLRFSSVDLSAMDVGYGGEPHSTLDAHSSDREELPSRSTKSTGSSSSEESDTAKATKQLNQIFDPAQTQQPEAGLLLRTSCTSLQDLDHLISHRRSQAAEMGQLLPRSRPPSAEQIPAHRSRPNSPFPLLQGPRTRGEYEAVVDPFKNPPTHHNNEQDTSVPSFQSFLDSDPKNNYRQQEPLMEDIDLSDPVNTNERLPMASSLASGYPSDASRDQILRKVNSGFEILRPGSFPGPVDGNGGEETLNEVGHGRRPARRLHKKQLSLAGTGYPYNL